MMEPKGNGLSMMQGVVLDMTAEGKSPRQIAEVLGIKPSEAAKMAYDLLDSEIVTDVEQRRKLQVYRLEKIVEALWTRVMRNAEKDDVKNLVVVLEQLNTLMALNKEQDAEEKMRMHSHQFATYMATLMTLVQAFKIIVAQAKDWDDAQWASWTADQMEVAQKNMTLQIEES